MKNRIARTLLICLPLAAAFAAEPECPAIKDSERAKLIDYVHKKYKTPATLPLDMKQTAVVGGSCYRMLRSNRETSAGPFNSTSSLHPTYAF